MSCDPATNGFQFTKSYVLGLGGEELTTLDGSNTWLRTNVYVGGRLTATYDLAGLHFHLSDPLGTRRVQLNGNLTRGNLTSGNQTQPLGQAELDCQSLPYGDQQSCTPAPNAPSTSDDATPLHFTGKERDAESGNDYFGARYYASTMGRFMSADSGVDQDVSDPQSWNLYSYVRNNPVTKTDSDGRSVQICSNDSNGNQQCQTISDEQYQAAQQASNSGGLSGTSLSNLQNSSSGSGTITDSSGATVGTVQWTPDNPGIQGPQAIQAFGQIGNQGMGAINWFGQQMALNVAGGVAGAGIGMAFDAFKASAAIGEILAKAGSAVGNTSLQVASREAAEQAAKQWVGEGARQLVDRGTGKVIGEISADGTKVARFTSAETKGYINLESKTTGSNLHVRWQ